MPPYKKKKQQIELTLEQHWEIADAKYAADRAVEEAKKLKEQQRAEKHTARLKAKFQMKAEKARGGSVKQAKEAVQPVHAMQPMQPMQPVEAVQPVQPMQPMQPAEAVQPIQPQVVVLSDSDDDVQFMGFEPAPAQNPDEVDTD